MVWEVPANIVLPIYLLAAIAGIALILKLSKDKTRKISNLRFYVQILAVIAIFMGLILGPFDQPLWAPLGISPRDRLLGADILGNQMPVGIPAPFLACYYPNAEPSLAQFGNFKHTFFPFWNYPRGYEVIYSTTGLEKLGVVIGSLVVAALVLAELTAAGYAPLAYSKMYSQGYVKPLNVDT
jgi:hypothetical protein